ncbi:phosphatidylinositol transfer protein [Xylariaceae sp. FL1651]|nr:phosphatidylinositol transfer protein [Xylariaceae sp. FL1651]
MKAEDHTAETGFVGSLTADQEKKLQQIWALLLGAFNFDDAKHEETVPRDPAPAGSQKDGATPDHKVDMGKRSVNDTIASELYEAWLNMVKQENPDGLLLRFLRARKWDVAQAFSMLNGAIIWRCKEARVDEDILPKGESWCAKREKTAVGKEQKEAHDYLEQMRLGKVYLHGMDRLGRPVGYVHVALHKPGAQSQETLEKLIVQTIETARCLLVPPIESACLVFDLTGFSLSNMEWQPVKFIIRAFEANYPECLGILLIHNAPWIFSGIWKIIRGLLDPVVAAKVNFTRNLVDMRKYIPEENIIPSLGGTERWHYQYHEPSEGEDTAITQVDAREKVMDERREVAYRFLAATQSWLAHVNAGEREEAAIQQELRYNAIEALRENYWKLDPYVRSRTNLDRTGVITSGGSIELYPERKAGTSKDPKKTTASYGGATEAAYHEVAVTS